VRGGAVRARERRGDGGAAGGADRAAGRAAGRRVEHEHLRRGAVPLRGGRGGGRRADAGAAPAWRVGGARARRRGAGARGDAGVGAAEPGVGVRAGEVRPGSVVPDGRRGVRNRGGGGERTRDQLRRGEWEVRGPGGEVLAPVATPEWKRPNLASVYALSKYDQERLCLMIGAAYGIPAVALRFFNVYGPRQALSNPYTGVLAIFAARVLNGRAPLIFEDGVQQRDLVSVYDVARACVLALERPEAVGAVLNVGSGRAYTIRDVAARVARALGRPEIGAEITGKYRVGDIRHCFADITRAREVLGYAPRVSLDDGLTELAAWLDGQLVHDRVDEEIGRASWRGRVG